jgi:hypothetical protein
LVLVVEDKREHAIEVVGGIGVKFSVQRDDDLAIRGSLEVVSLLEVLSNVTMVVDLTVDSENDAVIGVGQRLSAGLNTDNAKALMAQNGMVGNNASTPVGATVTNLLCKLQSRGLELFHVGMTERSQNVSRAMIQYQLFPSDRGVIAVPIPIHFMAGF